WDIPLIQLYEGRADARPGNAKPSSEGAVGTEVELRTAVQVQRTGLTGPMRRHFRARIGTQIAIASFDRGIAVQFLEDTGLQACGKPDVAVAGKAAALLLELDQTAGHAAEQLGVVAAPRNEHVVAAEQILLAQLVAIVTVGDVFVGRVIATIGGFLTSADAPGTLAVDHLVQLRVAEVGIQRVGLLDIVVGLAPGQTDEIVVGLGSG